MLTDAFERYLDAIFMIEDSGSRVRVKDIAESLGVSNPSVSEMVERLVENGLATHDKYGHIGLTPRGRRIARELNRKHSVIKRFFVNVLGVSEETAERDACLIEHVISDESLESLVEFLETITGAGGENAG